MRKIINTGERERDGYLQSNTNKVEKRKIRGGGGKKKLIEMCIQN